MKNKPKFKKGDKCKIINSILLMYPVGTIVTIQDILIKEKLNIYICNYNDDFLFYCRENALELVV